MSRTSSSRRSGNIGGKSRAEEGHSYQHERKCSGCSPALDSAFRQDSLPRNLEGAQEPPDLLSDGGRRDRASTSVGGMSVSARKSARRPLVLCDELRGNLGVPRNDVGWRRRTPWPEVLDYVFGAKPLRVSSESIQIDPNTTTQKIQNIILYRPTFTLSRQQDNELVVCPVAVGRYLGSLFLLKTWETLYINKKSVLDAVEAGCSKCEELQCRGTVGFGGNPDEDGETTLDAMIMDGETHDVGAVGNLRRIKSAISVARKVMEHTSHTLLTGSQATQFAVRMGFKEEDLNTSSSMEIHKKWKENSCQPNHRINVTPNSKTSCGPYSPNEIENYHDGGDPEVYVLDKDNHDTISMLAVDENGRIAGGATTNGLSHKVPGRVGDSPIPGSGVYVDKDVGGATATGNGDIMIRFSPALITVEGMRNGLTPEKSAQEALFKISKYYPKFFGAIIAATINGDYGAACHGYCTFPFSVINPTLNKTTVKRVKCIKF
ncbi:N(4)-(Beta-N-acetylglucosaminyl)-L-asparaginase-like [Oratosquilla oratoria]|uniref:N(4)-(Beta-N-acetylglucosaminyl)-L-asparaginase- like n=1 Tax=Oratosquilla oratoria TaxID=337810 RepID=UPI003F76A487